MSNKPHKWADVIKAWADGAEIEYRYLDVTNSWSVWAVTNEPRWLDAAFYEYRVKPQPVEPVYLYVYNRRGVLSLDVNAYDGSNCVGKFKLESVDV